MNLKIILGGIVGWGVVAMLKLHVVPVYWGGHMHWNELVIIPYAPLPCITLHNPPFWHGFGWHASFNVQNEAINSMLRLWFLYMLKTTTWSWLSSLWCWSSYNNTTRSASKLRRANTLIWWTTYGTTLSSVLTRIRLTWVY